MAREVVQTGQAGVAVADDEGLVADGIAAVADSRRADRVGDEDQAFGQYAVLEQAYGVLPISAEETSETAAASPRDAELLQTDTGSPLLILTRHSFDASDAPIEWVRSLYRGDRYRFVARLSTP